MAFSMNTKTLYQSVVDDVINNVRDFFLDDGSDEQTLQELKQLWESKLSQSKALEPNQTETQRLYASYTSQRQQPRQVLQPKEPHVIAPAATSQPQPLELKPVPTIIQPQQPQQQQPQPAQIQVQQHPVVQQQQPQGIQSFVLGADGNPVQLSSAAQAATMALPAGLYQPQPAAAQVNLAGLGTLPPALGNLPPGTVVQVGGTQYVIGAAPTGGAFTVPQQQQGGAPGARPRVQGSTGRPQSHVTQTDGANDSSSDDDDDDAERSNDDDDENDEKDEENEDAQGEEEDPLNSDDDISEADPEELFETDNVVVCQFDKINRAKNRWKFHLKDGIMNLNGKDYVFQKANGDAEW